MILMLSRAWPSPLWAYNTFSHVLQLSLSLLLIFLLFDSIPFHSIMPGDLFLCHLIPFDSFLLRSV